MMPRRAFPVLFWVIAKSNMPPVKAKQQHKPSSPSKPASLRTIPLNTQTHGKSFHWTQQINPKGQTQKSKTTTKTPRDTHRNTHTQTKNIHTHTPTQRHPCTTETTQTAQGWRVESFRLRGAASANRWRRCSSSEPKRRSRASLPGILAGCAGGGDQ